MNIDQFFEEIQDTKRAMERALKKYVEAAEDFYNITGIKYTDMPKSKGKALGFDDLMIAIEDLYDEYLILRQQHNELFINCMHYINRLDNSVYKLIIEYSFINLEDDKQVAESLREFHNIHYTNAHVRKLKSKAVKEFQKIIDTL